MRCEGRSTANGRRHTRDCYVMTWWHQPHARVDIPMPLCDHTQFTWTFSPLCDNILAKLATIRTLKENCYAQLIMHTKQHKIQTFLMCAFHRQDALKSEMSIPTIHSGHKWPCSHIKTSNQHNRLTVCLPLLQDRTETVWSDQWQDSSVV